MSKVINLSDIEQDFKEDQNRIGLLDSLGRKFKNDLKEKEFYLNLRQKQAKKFDEQLIEHGGCLAPFFKVIKEQQEMREESERLWK